MSYSESQVNFFFFSGSRERLTESNVTDRINKDKTNRSKEEVIDDIDSDFSGVMRSRA